jgi:hypothetical protein
MALHSNFTEFATDWNNTVEVIGQTKMFFIAEICFDALKYIIMGSPVDTGTFRASHDLTIAYASGLKLIKPDRKENGSRRDESNQRLTEGENRLDAFSWKQFAETGVMNVFITNNLDYAQYLEEGNSKRPGIGLFEAARARAERNWNRLIQRGLV